MFRFKFKKHKESQKEREFVEKEIKKLPMFFSVAFCVYIVLFSTIMVWYFYFKATYYIAPVQGLSMQPTINTEITTQNEIEDFVYVNPNRAVNYGDIITLSTTDSTYSIIKRVIGKGGDYVSIYVADDGYYHVAIIYKHTRDIVVLNEDYIKSYPGWTVAKDSIIDGANTYEKQFYDTFLRTKQNTILFEDVYFYQIPENTYFCLGDNRALSNDSRAKGVFTQSQVEGVAEIIVKDGGINNGWLFGKKISAIFGYYWSRVEEAFAR